MLNKLLLIGRITQPEIKRTPSGVAICNFSLATSEKYKGEETTTWHKIITFNKTAELCEQYLWKGSKIYLEGKIQNRSYEKDGATVYVTEVVANTVTFLDSKAESKAESQAKPQNQSNLPDNSGKGFDPSQDIPF